MIKLIKVKSANKSGFTLIEMLITIAIIGILASIAYPSYTDYVLRSNRTEAQRELIRLANMQEQLFVDRRIYTQDMTLLGAPATPYITESGKYSISTVVIGRTFTLTATALGIQAADTDCTPLAITEAGLRTPVNDCWE